MFGGAENGGGGAALDRGSGSGHPHQSPQRLSIRGGSGLGDAIYLQSIARYFVEQGYRPEVCCDWPDVFRPLGDLVDVAPFRRKNIDRLAHYAQRRHVAGTSQFDDGCIQAGISGPVEFKLGWGVINPNALRRAWNPHDLPIIVVQMPRAPFGRSDGFGMEFLPDCRRIQDAIERIGSRAFFVQVGKGEPLFRFSGIDLDLTNQTSVCDLLDVATLASGFLGYCSYIVPLAEAQSKPGMLVWSRKGLSSPHQVVRQMTPQKILHRPSSRWVMDDASDKDLMGCTDAFLDSIRSGGAV